MEAIRAKIPMELRELEDHQDERFKEEEGVHTPPRPIREKKEFPTPKKNRAPLNYESETSSLHVCTGHDVSLPSDDFELMH
jgi:hypothetical protein